MKAQALEILSIEGEKLKEPYRFQDSEHYEVVIIDAENVHYFFLKDENGELFYDGWCAPSDSCKAIAIKGSIREN